MKQQGAQKLAKAILFSRLLSTFFNGANSWNWMTPLKLIFKWINLRLRQKAPDCQFQSLCANMHHVLWYLFLWEIYRFNPHIDWSISLTEMECITTKQRTVLRENNRHSFPNYFKKVPCVDHLGMRIIVFLQMPIFDKVMWWIMVRLNANRSEKRY